MDSYHYMNDDYNNEVCDSEKQIAIDPIHSTYSI